METIPYSAAAAAAAAAPDSSRPAAAASDTVLTGDIDGTSSSRSNIMSDEKMIAAKERFYELLDEKDSKKKTKRTKLLSEQEYDEICNVLKGWKVGAEHSNVQSKWRQNYILFENTSRSAALRWNKNNENLKVATKEEAFTIIMEVHIALAHAKDTRKIYEQIKKTWYGITQEDVKLALHLCPVCMASQTKITAKQMPLKMILSETIGSRAQMDLIDMTSQQDNGYCWILRLIDHLSGFGAVKALKSKTSKECGVAIIQILSFFPDFVVLQSDNGGEFLGDTIKYVNQHFPDTHILKGRSRHPQSQGGIERGNAPFKTGLQGYMQEEKTTKWAGVGIYVVQRGINKRTSRSKGGHSPYEAFFGKKTENGPNDILDKHIVEQCLIEAALVAAVAFVQSEEHSIDDRLAPNFNDRIIQVIRKADASFEEEDAEEESMKPAATNVGGVDGEESTKLKAGACAMADDVLVEEQMKTADADDVFGVKNEGDEEPTIDDEAATSTEVMHTASTPTKASTHHQSDTPRRGKIRKAMGAAQTKQAIAVNKRRKSSTYVEFLEVGDMCKIEVEGKTRAATDYKYLPVKVTACRRKSSKCGRMTTLNHYQIASRDGYLQGWYTRENLEYDPMTNVKIAGIDTEKEGFLKDLTIARASALYNQSGGATTCQCQSDCAKNRRCRCKSVGNFCTSKCHGGRGKNSKCTNCMPVAVDVHNPSPPGQTPPPGSNNLCTEVNDLQQSIQPTNHAPTPNNDKKPAADKKAPLKRKQRNISTEEETVIEVRGGNPGEYEAKPCSSSSSRTKDNIPSAKRRRKKCTLEEETMIEVRGGNAGEYRDEVFADTRAPAPDNEKKPAAKPVPGNESPVNEVVNPAAKQISKEKEAVKETQHTAAKFDSWGMPYPYQELRAGCVLEYYHPMAVAGTPGALREATVIEIKPSSYCAEEFMLSMDNMDFLDSSHPAQIVKHVVNGELVDCKSGFRLIDNYEIIQSKIGSMCEVVQKSASSFRTILDANMNMNAPEGMPVDILNFRAEDGAVDGCALTEYAKELKMDDDQDKDKEEKFSNEVTMRRLRRASKMAVNMLNSNLTPSQQNIVDGAINGPGPLHEVLANSDGNQVQRRSMQRLQPEVWLDDEIVNYFLKVCLASRDKNMHNDNTNHKRSHFFTSFFVQNLFDEC